MNTNLSPDVQHDLDRQYIQEMRGYRPAPETPWDYSLRGFDKNSYGVNPMTQ